MFYAIIATVLLIVVTFLKEVFEHHESAKTTRPYKVIRIFLLGFIFLMGIANIIAIVIKDREDKKEIDRLSNQITQTEKNLGSKSDEVTKLSEKLLTKTEEIADLNRSLSTKSDKIADLNRDIAGIVSGGDSYCYVDLESLSDGKNTPLLVLVNEGNYPLYDVFITIVDLDKFRDIKEFTLENIAKAETRLNMGNIASKQARILSRIQLPDKNEKDYNVINLHFPWFNGHTERLGYNITL
jgi:hypothetical protein